VVRCNLAMAPLAMSAQTQPRRRRGRRRIVRRQTASAGMAYRDRRLTAFI